MAIQHKHLKALDQATPQCELRTTGRAMVECHIFINGILQPVPPVWIPVEKAPEKKSDVH
jgi:hypothetical protein